MSNVGGAGGKNLRQLLFEAGQKALKSEGSKLKKELSGFTGKGKSMDTSQSLNLQFKVGEYSNLGNTVTGMEKMMKDTIAAAARNTS